MLTGRRTFEGKSQLSVASAILEKAHIVIALGLLAMLMFWGRGKQAKGAPENLLGSLCYPPKDFGENCPSLLGT
jgi:hypothetical protein